MKERVVLFLFCTFLIYKNIQAQNNQFVYKFSIENSEAEKVDSIKINTALIVIKKRLLQLFEGSTKVFYEKSRNEIVIFSKEYLRDREVLRPLMKPNKVVFYECFSLDGFIAMLESNKTKKGIAIKDSFLVVANDKSNRFNATNAKACITSLQLQNIERYSKKLKSVETFYKSSFLFRYHKYKGETKSEYLQLYALKNNANKIEINTVLDSITVRLDYRGEPALNLTFDKKGTKQLLNLTSQNRQRFIAFSIDNEVVFAPLVTGEISEGRLEMSGGFTMEEIKNAKILLESGYLPLKLKIASVAVEAIKE
jgi:hypothetical protein